MSAEASKIEPESRVRNIRILKNQTRVILSADQRREEARKIKRELLTLIQRVEKLAE